MSNPAPAPAPKAPAPKVPAPAPAPAPTTAAAPAPATALKQGATTTTAAATTTKKKTVKKASGAGTTAKPKKKAARRKKPPSSARGSTPSATSAQNIWNAAALAQKELTQQSAQAAALRSDPLWYRTDDPVASIDKDSFMVTGGKEVLSDQVELVEAALAMNNLTRADVTPQAFACLLEQGRRYAIEILADAQDYAYSANRHDVSRADLLLAQELRADQPMAASTQQPKLLQLAQQVNRTPLPPIPTRCYTGVVLPPREHQLTARTFDVISGAQVAQRMVAAPPAPPVNNTTATTSNNKPSYGASRGRQIPIHISQTNKSKEAAASTGNGQSAAPSATTTKTGVTAPSVATMNAGAAAGAPSGSNTGKT